MTKKTRAKARRALLTMSLVLVVAFAAVGGTIAWLTASTEAVTNTFSPSTIKIDLNEHDKENNETKELEYKLVPGATLDKDPFVTVEAGSEACYVFVEIEYVNGAENYLTYTIGDKWEIYSQDDQKTVVYYTNGTNDITAVNALNGEQNLEEIFKGDVVTVQNVTTDLMNELYGEDGSAIAELPEIVLYAYAVQSDNNTSSLDQLWKQASGIQD